MSDKQTDPVDATDWKAEHYKLQVRLDEHLAERQGVLDAHAAEVAALKSEHEQKLAEAKEWAASNERKLAAIYADELAAHRKQAEEALALQAEGLAKQHAAEVTKLKESVLVPALADLHARQQADLEAKHQAAMAQLLG